MSEDYKIKYENACKLVADMHAAAMGEIVGPKSDVVGDILHLRAERLNWEKTAKEYAQGVDYYKGLLIKIGELLGEQATIQQDVINKTNLFQNGDFTLRSGQKSKVKIECDALTKDDWATLALMAIERIQPFKEVYGVPRGGIPFADALRPYCTPEATTILLAEDVVTTGGSIERYYLEHHQDKQAYSVCVFARNKVGSWITPIFQMGIK